VSMFGGMDGVYNEGPDLQGHDVGGADDGLSLVGNCQPRRRWPDRSVTVLAGPWFAVPRWRDIRRAFKFHGGFWSTLQNSPVLFECAVG